jgi:hypothetical protein
MSDNAAVALEWKVLHTFGPVFSHGGFKNWHLCLTREGIVAVPVGIWPSLLYGIGAGTANFWVMRKAVTKPSEVEGERILVDDGSPRWRRYPAGEIEKLFVKWCLVGANEIHLQVFGHKNHLYGLGDRDQTKACRESLRSLFPRVYSEQGFEKSS